MSGRPFSLRDGVTKSVQLFQDESEIRGIGEGLLDRSLPIEAWTHEAHLAACLWLIVERPDVDIDRELRSIIGGFNEAKGGVNSDTVGYHETITRCFVAGVRHWVLRCDRPGLPDRVNGLLQAEEGSRDWPLRFFTRERLFSVEARRGWVEPDRESLPCSEH